MRQLSLSNITTTDPQTSSPSEETDPESDGSRIDGDAHTALNSDPQKTRTSIEAYRELLTNEEDTILRKRVCAAIAIDPQTINEVTERFETRSANSIRPRVNELVLMKCVTREDKRTNPSGHDAYVHKVTQLGTEYLNGTADPEQTTRVSQHESDVVSVARQFVKGEASEDSLTEQLRQHDTAKQRMNPDWDGGLDTTDE